MVYKGRDMHLDRFVAPKVLPADRVADEDRLRRFVQEAKAASALNHPNIVHIYDIDRADGLDYIAMEYVQGRTLDQLVGRKGLNLPEALSCSIQITDALAKAHAAGIVHCGLHFARAGRGPPGPRALRYLLLRFGLLRDAHRPTRLPRRRQSLDAGRDPAQRPNTRQRNQRCPARRSRTNSRPLLAQGSRSGRRTRTPPCSRGRTGAVRWPTGSRTPCANGWCTSPRERNAR